MPYFLKSGTKFRVTAKEAMDLHDRLPVGTYNIEMDPCSGQFLLDQIENFAVRGKLYGSTTRHTDRILRTFMDRTGSTGVLLAGEKGSGKTLLAKHISVQAARQGIPTIVINKNWHGESFNAFLQKIEQPTIVLFDEYEKVYCNMQEQEKMLTLLDGVYPSKKLFLLTCNDKWRVDVNMRNRPGRIFYMLNFDGLEPEFIREYCEDNLLAKEHIPTLVAMAGLFCAFNFDMLKGVVEEMNRYNESPSEVLQFLNVRPEFSNKSNYTLRLIVNGKELKRENGVPEEWHGNPMQDNIQLHYRCSDKNCGRHHQQKFSAAHLKELDAQNSSYVFENDNKGRLVLTAVKKVDFKVDYDALASMPMKNSLATNAEPVEESSDDQVLDMTTCEYDGDLGDY